MNVKEIKEEIKEEESFLLKLFQLEKLVKKYQKPLIAVAVLIIVSFFGWQINSYLQTQKLIKTNQAYNILLKNPNDKTALQTLKENPKLFKLYLLQTSNNDINKLKEVANSEGIVANIAKYQIAVLKGDKKDIENYALTIGAIYKDLALLNVERIYLENNNHKKAQEIAKQIKDQAIVKLANDLLHYGIAK
jgi:hypothetical protein